MSTQVAEIKSPKLTKVESSIKADRYCISERDGIENNGDRVGVRIQITWPHNNCAIALTRSEWEAFKNGIDAGFADFPVKSERLGKYRLKSESRFRVGLETFLLDAGSIVEVTQYDPDSNSCVVRFDSKTSDWLNAALIDAIFEKV